MLTKERQAALSKGFLAFGKYISLWLLRVRPVLTLQACADLLIVNRIVRIVPFCWQ